jgi:4-alpha-glucanotransferase
MFTLAPFQDLLRLGSEARMNTPGTTEANWQWRMSAEHFEDDRWSDELSDLNRRTGRFSPD